MTDRETMKQVLDALNEIRDITQHYKAYDTIAIDAITALEARLAEPEQEPVAKVIPGTRKASEPPKQEPVAYTYLGIKNDGSTHGPHLCWKPEYMDEMSHSKGAIATPLYTAPPKPEWVGLTDEEINEAQEVAYRSFRRHEMSARGQLIMPADSVDWHFARAVEAKLKEKNHE